MAMHARNGQRELCRCDCAWWPGDDPGQQALRVLEFLNHARLRCTYGAMAGVLGTDARFVAQRYLGARRKNASWVVNKKSGEPTGYEEQEKHPELHNCSQVISDANELCRLVYDYFESK